MKKGNLSVNHAIVVTLAIAGLVLFSRTATNSFVNFDDPAYITENSIIQEGLTMNGIVKAFTATYADNWHPLTWLSHMLDIQLFGRAPGGHHMMGALLHSLNGVLLFVVLSVVTGKSWRSAFVAALFLVHPLHVESVAWASERKDLLCAFFTFLTLWAYLRFTARSAAKWYALALVFFAGALMAKPMAGTLPFVLLLADWWPLGRLRVGAEREQPPPLRFSAPRLSRLLLEKIPFLVLAAGSSVITVIAQKAYIQPIAFQARLTNALCSYAAYLGKTFWPSGLSVYYPQRSAHIPFSEIILVIALLAGLTILAVSSARRFPFLAFGWFWYVGTLVPVIGLVQVGEQAMADRYTYLPLIGVFIAVTWGISDLARRWALAQRALPVCSTTILLLLAALTWMQLGHWKNSVSLYRKAIASTGGNYVIMSNLGAELFAQKQYREAFFYFKESIRAEPRFEAGYYQAGRLLMLHGDCRSAVPYYRQAIALKPDFTAAIADLEYCVHDLSRTEGAPQGNR